MFNLKKKAFKKFDFILLSTILLLCAYGLVVIYSATLSLDSTRFVRTQSIATLLGLSAILFMVFFDYQFLGKMYIPIYMLSNLVLVYVLFMGVGDDQWGASRWVYIGSFGFQPSEFVKIGLIISLSKYMDIHKDNINSPFVLLKVLVLAFVPVVLVLLQPDAGTAMVFIFFIAAMLFVSGVKWKYIGTALTIGLMSLPILWTQLDQYQKDRVFNFLDPERDASNTGYQAMQGRIAIGSGKIFGRGLFQGTQTQFNYLPEKHNDFIFAVLVEELGFIGGSILILLYFILIQRIMKIASKTPDKFGSFMATGVAAMLLFHIWENIGMTIGLMPITGIPLPFMSYGGSYQLINLVSLGIVLSVGLHREGLSFD